MDPQRALDDLQQLVRDLRQVVRRAAEGELANADAAQRIDAALGPPVRTDAVARGSLTEALRAHQELVNGCRLALDRLRAGMVDEAAAMEIIGTLIGGQPYDDTQAEVHDMTLEPQVPKVEGADRRRMP